MAASLEQVGGMPPSGAQAAPSRDTRISIEESGAQAAELSSSCLGAVLVGPCDPAVGHGSAAAPGDTAPEDWRTRGLLATVEPGDTEEILRLRALMDMDTDLHRAARAQDVEALRELLAAGASPAALDWAGRTPLHLCVAHRLIEPLKVLLSVPGSADVRDASGWPLLHAALLHGWRDGARAILGASPDPDVSASHSPCSECKSLPQKPEGLHRDKFHEYLNELPLSIAIHEGDMDMFEAILVVAERNGVVDCLDGCGKTALHTAIYESNLPAIEALLEKGASPHKISDCNETALHVAVLNSNILKYFLDKTDVTSSLDSKGRAPEHIAAALNAKSMLLLFDEFNNTRVKSEPEGYTPLHCAALEPEGDTAAELIMDRDSEAINEVDNLGDTPLHVAIKHMNRHKAMLLLRKGAQLSATDKNETTASQLISRLFYKPSRFFRHVFDTFIFYKDVCHSNAILVNVDYRVLTDGKKLSQMNMLEELVNCGQSKVLLHPLIESLLYLKWRHFLPLFYAMIGVYTIFLFSSTVLMTSLFNSEHTVNSEKNNSGTLEASSSSEDTTASGGFQGLQYWLLVVLTYNSIFILLLQESMFINLKKRRYFVSAESWVKLCGLALCAATPPLAALAPGPWPRHAACAALLLAWLQPMFLVSRFPLCGYYVLMFGKAIVNMLKIFMTAIFLVIGFSFCFMIQYRSEAPFDGPFAAFVKTLVMMSSEFEYEDLFGEDHAAQLRDTSTVVRIFFTLFVVFVAIVFMNFMVGVAISDVNDLNETGNIRRLERQVELLSTFDALVYGGVLGRWLKSMFTDKRYHESMYTVKANPPIWNVRCWPHPYQPALQKKCYAISSLFFCKRPLCDNYMENPLPKEACKSDLYYSVDIDSPLHKAIVEIANKHEQQKKKDKFYYKAEKYKCKIDALYDEIVDSEEETEDDEDKRIDQTTLRKQMKSIVNDMTKVSNENKETKRCVEKLNQKIGDLSAISSVFLRSIKPGSNWILLSRQTRTRRTRRRAHASGARAQNRTKRPLENIRRCNST